MNKYCVCQISLQKKRFLFPLDLKNSSWLVYFGAIMCHRPLTDECWQQHLSFFIFAKLWAWLRVFHDDCWCYLTRHFLHNKVQDYSWWKHFPFLHSFACFATDKRSVCQPCVDCRNWDLFLSRHHQVYVPLTLLLFPPKRGQNKWKGTDGDLDSLPFNQHTICWLTAREQVMFEINLIAVLFGLSILLYNVLSISHCLDKLS